VTSPLDAIDPQGKFWQVTTMRNHRHAYGAAGGIGLLGLILLGAAIAIAVALLPEWKRYERLRDM
jgi:hypothetical protein